MPQFLRPFFDASPEVGEVEWVEVAAGQTFVPMPACPLDTDPGDQAIGGPALDGLLDRLAETGMLPSRNTRPKLLDQLGGLVDDDLL